VIEIVMDTEGKKNADIKKEFETKLEKQSAFKIAEAGAEIILRVDNGQLSYMQLKDPLEIWRDLQNIYHACGFMISLALCRKFLTAKKSDDQSMQSWIGQIQSQTFTIEEITGTEVSD